MTGVHEVIEQSNGKGLVEVDYYADTFGRRARAIFVEAIDLSAEDHERESGIVILTPKEALALAKALRKAAKAVKEARR